MVIVTALDIEQDAEELKRCVKEVCKSSVTIAPPNDVIVTKEKQKLS